MIIDKKIIKKKPLGFTNFQKYTDYMVHNL